MCVTMAADAHSASSSVSGGHAWEPLQTCGAGGYLQRGQLGVILAVTTGWWRRGCEEAGGGRWE